MRIRNARLALMATLVMLVAALIVAGCAPATHPATEAPPQTEAVAQTEAPTPVPTTEAPPEMGTADNPLVFVFVPSGDAGKILIAGTAITDKLTEMTGLTMKAEVPTSFIAAVEAMCAGKAQVGALNTFSYVLASQKECAEVTLVSIRNSSPTYTGQIIVRKDSGITKIEDLKGKTFCRPDPVSTSGWIMPSLLLKAKGIDPDKDLKSIKDAGGHPGVVKAVYNKECDAGATFGDARTNVQADLPDVMDVIQVLASTDPIPNDTVAYQPDVPEDIREKVTKGLIDMAAKEDTLAILKALYSWTGVQEVDDAFYDPFRQFLQAAGVKLEDYVK